MASARDLPHPFPRPLRDGAAALVSVFELNAARAADDPPTVLDVRPEAERRVARLDGDRWIPLAELPRRVGELPRGRRVVAYDQFGAQARRAARFLTDRGWDAAALEGGLDEFARLVDPTIPRYPTGLGDGHLTLRQLPRFETGCLAYFLGDPASHEAVLVDPGHEVGPYLALLNAEHWHLAAIVETHTHADHRAGHAELHQRTDAPILVSRLAPAQYPHGRLAAGDHVEFGAGALSVLETPGHTRDHLALRVGDHVLTGDTLLVGSCGRTDLGDGSPQRLWESLHQQLLALPDETEVLPAHFGPHHALPERYATSIGFERATNEALAQPDLTSFVRYMTEGWPPKPADFDRIVAENLATF